MTVKDYIRACCNLYGMVHEDRVLSIWNLHHPNNHLKSIDTSISEDVQEDHVYYEKGFFIHEGIYVQNEMSMFLKQTNNKPYFIPDKDNMNYFVEENYTSSSFEIDELFNFVYNDITDQDRNKAHEIITEVEIMIRVGMKIPQVTSNLEYYLTDIELHQKRKMIHLLHNAYNSFRKWRNNGYTNNELIKVTKKVSRNDLCPCGSLKKYKKCCIHKRYPNDNVPPYSYEDVF